MLPTLEQRLAARERPKYSNAMYQRWENLLFIHWEYDVAKIQQTLPPGLYVDTFEGRAFLGIVPFYMLNIRPRFLPAVPGISNFLEVNVRTYVHDDNGNSGVWFYSLDANGWLAVKLARFFYHLPYFHATMNAHKEGKKVTYKTCRQQQKHTSTFVYAPKGEVYQAEPDSLEFFLIERYILFALYKNKLFSGQVYHTPYPICSALVEQWDTFLLELNGFPDIGEPMHMVMSPGVNVDVFTLQKTK